MVVSKVSSTAPRSDSVQLIIEASDRASQTLKAPVAALQGVAQTADTARIKVTELGVAITALGGSVVQRIAGLGQVIESIRRTAESPVVKPFIQVIAEEAEAATKELAPLTQILGDLGDLSGSFGKGFLGLKGSVVNEFESKITRIADKVGGILSAPFQGFLRGGAGGPVLDFFRNAAKNFNANEIGQRLDKSLAKSLTNGLLDTALGEGPAQSFIKSIITSEQLRGFFPSLLGDIVGGSGVIKPLAKSLGLDGLLQFAETGIKLPVIPDVSPQALDKAIADFAIERALDKAIGQGVVQDFAKNIVRPLASVVGPDFVKRLAQGSFSGAIRSLFIETLTSGFTQSFRSIDEISGRFFSKLGTEAAEIVIRGPSEELRELIEGRFKGLDQVFGGVSGKFIKGTDALKLVPGLDKLDSLLGERISKAIGSSLDLVAAGRTSELIRQKAAEIGSGVVSQGLAQLLPKEIRNIVASALSDTPLTRFIASESGKLFQSISNSKVGQQLAKVIQQGIAPLTDTQVFRQISNGLGAIASEGKRFVDNTFKNLGGGLSTFVKSIADTVGPAFKKVDDFFENIFSESFGEIGKNSANSFAGAFTSRILSEITPAINKIDSLVLGAFRKISNIPQQLTGPLEQLSKPFGLLTGFDEPVEVFDTIKRGAQSLTAGIFELTENIFFFQAGLQALQQLALGGPFELLINQNVKLRETMIATQSTLVATNKIMKDGQEVVDPTVAIQSLEGPVRQAIEKIRQGSLELVNVTSKDLIETFSIIAGQAGNIGINLDQASELTLNFGATLGTLGVPLYQARQEVLSILTGTIDMNSIVAKSLGIQNSQVQNWKSQNRLVDELNKKLLAFRAGNAISSQTFGGITSNIQELVDRIGQVSGEKLLDPIVKQLGEFYAFLSQNEKALTSSVSSLVSQFVTIGNSVISIIKDVFTATQNILGQIPEYLVKSLANAVVEVGNAIKQTIQVLQPAINLFAELVKTIQPMGGFFLKTFLQVKALQLGISALSGGFGIISKILPGVGELMFLITGRTSGLINQFSTLSGILGGSSGAAGFLLLGKNLQSIPGLAQAAASALGPFGTIFVGLIPSIAGVGIQVAGLLKFFPPLAGVLQNLLALSPGLVGKFAALAGSTGLLGGALAPLSPLLFSLSGQLGKVAELSTFREVLNQKLKEALIGVGVQIRNQIISFGLLSAALYATFKVIDEFILKNQQVMEVLGALVKGLAQTAQGIKVAFTNPVSLAILAVTGLAIAVKFELIPALYNLLKVQLASFLLNAASGLTAVANTLNTVKLASLGAGAAQAAIGLQALGIAMLQGSAASAQFLAANGINVVTLSLLRANFLATIATVQAFIAAKIQAAIVMGRTFIASVVSAIVSLRTLRLSNIATAFSFGAMGTSATAAAGALNLVAIRAKMGAVFAALSASLSVVTAGFYTAATAAFTFAAGLAAALGPILAVVAAVGAFALINYTSALKDSNEATDQLSQQTADLGDQTLLLAKKLKDAKDKQADANAKGVKLSKEEYAENAKLQRLADNQIKTLNDYIQVREEALKGAVGDEDKRRIQQQIDELNKLKASLESLKGGVEIKPRSLPRLGTAYEQLATDARNAEKAILNSSGESEQFKQNVQKLLESTKILLEAGQISADEARRRLGLLTSNANVERDIQVQAQQAVTQSFQTETQKQVAIAEGQQANIEALAIKGELTEAESAKKITDIKLEQLNQQLENTRRAREAELEIEGTSNEKTLDEIDRKIAEAQQRLEAASGDPTAAQNIASQALQGLEANRAQILATVQEAENKVREIQERVKGSGGRKIDPRLQAELDQAQASLKGVQSQLSEVDNQIGEARKNASSPPPRNEAAISAAQTEIDALNKEREQAQEESNNRLIQINNTYDAETAKTRKAQAEVEDKEFRESLERTQKNAIRVAKDAETQRQNEIQKLVNLGVLRAEDAEAQKADAAKTRINAELQAEEAKLKELEANAEVETDAIKESKSKILELTQQSLQAEQRLYDAHLAVLRKKLLDEALKQENALNLQTLQLEKQQGILDAITKGLEQRNQLLKAAADLSKATSDYLTAEIDILAQGERSEYRKSQLAQLTAKIKLDAVREQNKLEEETVKFQAEQNRLALERQKIENQIAQNRKKSEIIKGDADIQVAQEELRRGKITQAEFDARVAQQDSLKQELKFLEIDAGLIQSQQFNQQKLDAGEIERTRLQSQSNESRALLELAQSLPPGLRERALRSLQEQISQRTFGTSFQNVRDKGVVAARQAAAQEFSNVPGSPGILSAFDPRLEALQGRLTPDQLSRAVQDVNNRFFRQFGEAGFSPILPPSSTQPLQIPQANLGQFGIQTANQNANLQVDPSQSTQQAAAIVQQGDTNKRLLQVTQANNNTTSQLLNSLSSRTGNVINLSPTIEVTVNATEGSIPDNVAQQTQIQLADVITKAESYVTSAFAGLK